MDIINQIATSWFGISGGEFIIIAVMAIVLIAAWVAVRAVVKITMQIFALGCASILGIALGLWLLFVVLR